MFIDVAMNHLALTLNQEGTIPVTVELTQVNPTPAYRYTLYVVQYPVHVELRVRVPGAGIEPAHLAARDFKSLVSTYSTIRALEG